MSSQWWKRKRHVCRAYRNYQKGNADEEKVKRELELLIHSFWQHRGNSNPKSLSR